MFPKDNGELYYFGNKSGIQQSKIQTLHVPTSSTTDIINGSTQHSVGLG